MRMLALLAAACGVICATHFGGSVDNLHQENEPILAGLQKAREAAHHLPGPVNTSAASLMGERGARRHVARAHASAHIARH